MDDGLVFVERCIQQNRDPGFRSERANEPPISRVCFFVDGLQPPRTVHVRHRWYDVSLLEAYRIDLHHERIRDGPVEILAMRLLDDGRREGPEFLTEFDFCVDEDR